MYGSTERYLLRTSTWPSPGVGTSASTRAKSSVVGQPTGRETRGHPRLITEVHFHQNTSVPETTMRLNISACQVTRYSGRVTTPPKTHRPDELTFEVVDLIGAVVARYHAEYEEAAAEHALTGAQARLLSLL